MTSSVASAPASSANLGPGFDTIALALDLQCVVRAEPAGDWSISHGGPEPFIGTDADDAILVAARRASDVALRIQVENSIPLSRGLGSSAAAFTSGTLAAMRANGQSPDHDALFERVRELEGHPDNAAAAVYGGLVAVAAGQVIHLTLSRDLIPVLAVPRDELRTSEARRVLPSAHETEVVSRTLGRFTGLVEGLRIGSEDLLALASGDELHEAPRTDLNPAVARMMAVANTSGALHSCWSGAGPSVLALTNDERVADVVAALEAELAADGQVLIIPPDRLGAR